MSFLALIVKNLVRQPARTLLTVLGISIGITTVVALGVIANSIKATSGEILKTGGSDFMVAQKGTADLSFSTVSEADWAAVGAHPDVERASGILFHITRAGSNPFFPLLGVRPSDLIANPPPLREGTLPAADATDQILLGDSAADGLNAVVGDVVTISDAAFQVVGIYHTGSTWEDAGGYAPLATIQQLAAKSGVVTAVFVTVREGADPRAVALDIESQFPNLTTVSEMSELSEVDQGIQIIDAATIAISVLAVGIGAIGVMNTMVMSVFERTRQIGVLRAVGWGSFRILRMVIGESLLLCAVAAVAGSLLGVLATRAVTLVPAVGNLLQPEYSPDVFVRGLIVAAIVALVGAAYPAFRAVRLSPMEALRHE